MRKGKLTIAVGEGNSRLIEETASTGGLSATETPRREFLGAATDRTQTQNGFHPGLPLLSLFCGAGGLDEGFRQAGFTTELATDIDKEAVATFLKNHKNAKGFLRDVRELTVAELDAQLGRAVKPVGVLGGPPCQSFSVSNVHQRDDDPRHGLPEAYAALLKDLNSRHPISFFVFENVPGLLGKKHRTRYDAFKTLFADAGFDVEDRYLNTQDYGVPQDRQRVVIIGINRGLHPDADLRWPDQEDRVRTVREFIYGLPEPLWNQPGLDASELPVHPNHWCMVPRSDKFRTENALVEGQAYGRSFRTLAWDKPSWTVAYGHREVHVHPAGHRRLSVYEAMLLQSFPTDYQLTGNISAQFRLVSDAMPPRLAWHIACAIRRSLGI